MSAIRTWTLMGEHGAHTVLGEKLEPFHRIKVIEADPVLDLLERAYNTIVRSNRITDDVAMQLLADLGPSLRAHGRLGGET